MSITAYTNPFFSAKNSSVSDVNFISGYPDEILFKLVRNSSFSHCGFFANTTSVSLVIENTSFSDCAFNASQIANAVAGVVFENSSFVLFGNGSFANVCENSLFSLTAIDVNYTDNRLFGNLTNV